MVNVLKFESAMMSTNSVVSTNPRIMDVVFVISLTHKHFIDKKSGKFYLSLFPLFNLSRLVDAFTRIDVRSNIFVLIDLCYLCRSNLLNL